MNTSVDSIFNIVAAIVIGVLMIISGFVLRPTGIEEKPKKAHSKP